MIEMGEFDSFKRTLIQLLCVLRLSSWSTRPPHGLHLNWTPKVLSWTPTSCRLCAKTPALDQWLWFVSSSSSSGTEPPSLPTNVTARLVGYQSLTGSSFTEIFFFNSSLPFYTWQEIQLKTKTKRFWYQKLEITLKLSSCRILVI